MDRENEQAARTDRIKIVLGLVFVGLLIWVAMKDRQKKDEARARQMEQQIERITQPSAVEAAMEGREELEAKVRKEMEEARRRNGDY